jgi:hypothetical protein
VHCQTTLVIDARGPIVLLSVTRNLQGLAPVLATGTARDCARAKPEGAVFVDASGLATPANSSSGARAHPGC